MPLKKETKPDFPETKKGHVFEFYRELILFFPILSVPRYLRITTCVNCHQEKNKIK